MAFVHGKGTVFRLDDLSGALQDVSSAFRSATGLEGKSDRPMTTTFGAAAHRRQVLGLRDGGPISLGGFFQQTAGTKVHGRNTRVLFDQYALTGYLNNATIRRTVDLPETTVFGESWRRRQVVGLMDGSINLAGRFDPLAGASDPVFRAALASASPVLVSVAPGGFAIGNLVDLGQFVMESYGLDSQVDGLVPVTGDFTSDERIDMGVSLHDLTAETGTVNSASVDETAATNSGWVAFLHVTAYTGGGSVTFKIQDSADNSVWADLVSATFTAVTGVTKERLEGAATAQVRRYVRSIISAFTATSVTYSIVLARRAYVYGGAGTYRHLVGCYANANSQTWEYGPDGSTTGKPRLTGEARMASLETTFPVEDTIAFSSEFVVDGAVTENTWP